VALALGFSVVALYYYLKVLKAIFVSEENGALDEKPVDLASGAVVLMLALLTVAVGIWPQKIIAFIKTQLFHGLG
jgi:NADH:ubiquinone oxidoreductase subunit 2 (subunit N)